MSSAEAHQPYDEGLQAERTLLAWRRTALALAVVSAVGIRFTAPVLGWPAVVLGAVGVGLGMMAYLVTGVRYRQVHRDLVHSDRHSGNGWPQVCLTLACLALGVTALLYVVVSL